jgi:hypothetical protein
MFGRKEVAFRGAELESPRNREKINKVILFIESLTIELSGSELAHLQVQQLVR